MTDLAQTTSQNPAREKAWLSIVGIGEDGTEGLGAEARALIASADIVYGGVRHLELAAALISGEPRRWPGPFDIRPVVALRGRKVCVLASGDPFSFGVGGTLSRHVKPHEMRVVPAVSAFSLAAARLGWPLQDVACISLHGRAQAALRPWLQPRRRILALTSGAKAPAEIAAMLAGWGFAPSRLTLLEALGGARERILDFSGDGPGAEEIDPLNVLAIEVSADAEALPLAFAAGRPEILFENDGQITRAPVRAMTLAALAPQHGELLWDIGAGSGAIGIEWMLAHPSLQTIAVEKRADRAARVARNAQALGVPGLQVVEGEAPEDIEGLPVPDAIFVGGGGSAPGLLDTLTGLLRPGGRLVANAVTLEMEAALLAFRAGNGGALTRIALAEAEPVGSLTGWRPAMPVTQFVWTKP